MPLIEWLTTYISIHGETIIIVIFIGVVGLTISDRPGVSRQYRRYLLTLVALQFALFIFDYVVLYWTYWNNPIGRYFLPPHSLQYLKDVASGLTNLLVGLGVTAILVWVGYWLLRIKKVEYFGPDDVMLISLGAIAVGWPATFIFLAMTFVLSVLGLIALVLIKKKTVHDRLIVTPFIIPAAIVTMIFRIPLLEFTHLNRIQF